MRSNKVGLEAGWYDAVSWIDGSRMVDGEYWSSDSPCQCLKGGDPRVCLGGVNESWFGNAVVSGHETRSSDDRCSVSSDWAEEGPTLDQPETDRARG